jgi:hypothetical protein
MEIDALVGSWTADNTNLEFKADGTYIRVSSFDMGITTTYANLSIDEEGTYNVAAGTVTFTPTSGHYRRNGVDEGFELEVRQASFRIEGGEGLSKPKLVLDTVEYAKD